MAYFLSCANLTSPTCTLGDYVIDWALNSVSGDIVFTSANSGNEEEGVDAYHPLVDEVVRAGTLYPIIRYVYISGVKNTSEYESDALYSPDLKTCLSPIVVDPINCNTSNFTPTTNLPYDFRIVRDVNIGSKDRSFYFEISSDTQYIAWAFDADNIADGVEVYYCTLVDSTGILIDNIVSGVGISNNFSPISYPTNPIVVNNQSSQNVKYVSDLTGFTYTVGDFIKFKIIGNYYNPSLDGTKWTIYLRCLDSIDPLPDMTPVFTRTSDIEINYDSINCNYEFLYDTVEQANTYPGLTTSDFAKYFYLQKSTNGLGNSVSGNIAYHSWQENASTNGSGGGDCEEWQGTVTLSKVGSVITYTFTDPADYDIFELKYNEIIGTSDYAVAIVSDPSTDIEYYSYISITSYTGLGGCDDSPTPIQLVYSIHSTWTLDPINKEVITINLNPITNDLIEFGICNNWNETAASTVDFTNETIALADFSYTYERYNSSIMGDIIWYRLYPINPRNFSSQVSIPKILLNNIYSPTNALGYVDNLPSNYWSVFYGYDLNLFSNITSHETRLNSWCYSRSRYFTTLDQTDLGTYDVINCAPSTTTTTTTTSP